MNREQMEKTFGGPVTFGRARPTPGGAWYAREKHRWCRTCLRTFPNGAYRTEAGLERCPYAGCGGNTAEGALDWTAVRLEHPAYPPVPWMDVRYP